MTESSTFASSLDPATQIKVGPHFVTELQAAGIDPKKPFGWDNATGALLDPENALTPAEKTTFNQVMEAHDPSKKP